MQGVYREQKNKNASDCAGKSEESENEKRESELIIASFALIPAKSEAISCHEVIPIGLKTGKRDFAKTSIMLFCGSYLSEKLMFERSQTATEARKITEKTRLTKSAALSVIFLNTFDNLGKR